MNILICDDDREIAAAIAVYLQNEGYATLLAYDGRQALSALEHSEIQLIIMDVMMPEMDGLRATMEIRRERNIPIIMLSAKSEDTDKLLGFDYGADDYITKPFNILELKARIRALLRRSNLNPVGESDQARITIGHISIDSLRRHAERSGTAVELTAKEFDVIELLMKNPGRVYSRENLLDLIWGYDYQGDIRTVDVHIRRLREKLEPEPANPARILTKWGVGYYLKAEE